MKFLYSCKFMEELISSFCYKTTKLKLMVFERKIVRRIYGPTKVRDGTCRIKSNEELNRLIGNKNIINCIKTQRLAWFGHAHRIPDDRMVKKVNE
jgi:hypothetical protein